MNISDTSGETFIQHVVPDLTAGTEYSFSLFTVLNEVSSSGFIFTEATAPENVENVSVITQDTSSITLQWDKVNGISTYKLQYKENGDTVINNISNADDVVQHVVSNLTAGTEYSFTLFTEANGVKSSGLLFSAATAPENVESVSVITQNTSSITLQWDKVNNTSTYKLQYDSVTKNINDTSEETFVQHVVSDLTAGTEYNFTLFTEANGVSSSGLLFSAATAPENVVKVDVVARNTSSITLQWDKINDTSTYKLQYEENGDTVPKNINDISGETFVQHVVPDLTAGTEYNFILFTVLNDLSSSGLLFSAATAPENVESVSVITQNTSSITLQWDKVNNTSTYKLQYDSVTKNINDTSGETFVQHVVSDLTAGTEYNFTLFTEANELSSSGLLFSAATAPENVESVSVITQNTSSITLKWDKVNNISTYELQYDSVTKNISDTSGETFVQHVVSDLTAGTEYSFTLFTEANGVSSSGFIFSAATAPENVVKVDVVAINTRSITLQWDKVNNISTYKLQYEKNGHTVTKNISNADDVVQHVVSDLTAGTEYSFILFTEANGVSSSGLLFSAATDPENVASMSVVTQSVNSITLKWDKVNGISTYKLEYEENGDNVTNNINDTSGETFVQHVVSGLTAGTEYNFTLFTEANGVKAVLVFSLTAATVPLSVTSVRVSERLVDRVTLQWENPNPAWKHNLSINDTNASITQEETTNVSYLISNLKPGTMYEFSVITVFSGLNSSAYVDHTVTQIDCSAVSWSVTNSSIQGTVEGLFSKATASNGSEPLISPEGKNVTFSDLLPGATYEISLLYETSSERYSQCSIEIPIIPPSLAPLCSYWGSGYSAQIKWDEPDGVWTTAELSISGKTFTLNPNENRLIVDGLQPAKKYKVSVISRLETKADPLISEPSIFFCSTDNRGVIGGSVVGVLLFAVLICVVVFLLRKKPDIIRKVPFILESKTTERNERTVSAAKFPDHFQQLSLDENRGFSQEYEALVPVGTDQTCKAAILPENSEKNRFNILPYDWCRVKLNTSAPNETGYINASYIPGYSSSREYIATQDPLPNTVVDFWRMIWEQKVKRVVMVTNHIEAERTKCAQYWPEGMKQRQYGDVLVSVTSELKEQNWTLRQFTVKQKRSSEERSVKHFHFTVWPDRGVPQGTEVLIQFRRIVRQDTESDGSESPTVVHCSDGVGRTGTFIALDFLLQQLEKQQAVGIKDFLHRMRRHRSHMVQTESQYIFLHQCIMDRLQRCATQDEHVYENDDTLYANTIYLKEII
ncbi:receptor-type tyrosine-protein phosphatase H isoform X15 [Xiphophorus hellerii]|uniref:receptor-type tyrosine-protein phosphatase H isoform X15 n=1 Tax=Xiphophorus hellerii TaxID=8084 RepID=UPI0013B419D9|nr:receptor-type tyrosine-protein phosphatase H isoform X15 [Xiphophorus hellerii]